jgi:thiamine-monophosphate kinase
MNNISKVSLIETLYEKSGIPVFKGTLSNMPGDVAFTSHKLMLEGIDFDLMYTPLKHLGYKAVLATIGPVYAGGFTPASFSITIAISARFTQPQLEELWEGVTTAAKEHKIPAISLDIFSSLTGMTISMMSNGKQRSKLFVHKPECRPGDLLCITGSLGAAYMGLQILEREKRVFEKNNTQPKLEDYKTVLRPYLNPYIDITLFDAMQSTSLVPSAGHFITNGLADSVKRICLNNKTGAKIFLDKIPLSSDVTTVAQELNIDPMTAVLNGGEDFQFLFSFPLEKHELLLKEMPQLDIIGHLADPDAGANLVTPDGKEIALKAQAWDK